MDTHRQLYLPEHALPATIKSIAVSTAANLAYGDTICLYEHHDPAGNLRRDELTSPYEGTINKILVRVGDTIQSPSTPVAQIVACTHDVQFGGLCALCGKDLSVATYAGPENALATINMTHDVPGLTVSREEAERIEKENTDRLLASRRLSLIVDLDQTIIHATWDPTVEDWMKDEKNVNHPATKDIRKFVLPGSPLVYYIKLRPDLRKFLSEVTKLYELHIYTMGTRNYAEAVAKEIDPDKEYFKERILSRDESGSMTRKTIQRLFPCDTSMVVVIDDRSDVWDWSPNLIKVQQYDFFVGIGDINASFLPKRDPTANSTPTIPLPPTQPTAPPSPPLSPGNMKVDEEEKGSKEVTNDDSKMAIDTESTLVPTDGPSATTTVSTTATVAATVSTIPTVSVTPPTTATTAIVITASTATATTDDDEPEQLDPAELAQRQQEQDALKEVQQQTRPLLQKQKELSEQNRPVLVDDDKELSRLLVALKEVHKKFYDLYDSKKNQESSSRTEDSVDQPDVKVLIPLMKRNVLQGVNILFTSVIPLGQDPRKSEIWRLATQFGAECSLELSSRVTHVVAGKKGTAKVNAARRRQTINIVRTEWLIDSIAKWERQDEKGYLLEVSSETTHNADGSGDPSTPFAADEEMDENDIANPESTAPPDLDDFDLARDDDAPAEHLSVSLEEVAERTSHMDWNDADREVDEALAESGVSDWDDDEELGEAGTESESMESGNDRRARGRKRKSQTTPRHTDIDDGERGSDGESDTGSPRLNGSRLSKRVRISRSRKSGLSKMVKLDEDEDEDDNDVEDEEDENAEDDSGDDEDDEGESAGAAEEEDEDDFLEALAGKLDEELD